MLLLTIKNCKTHHQGRTEDEEKIYVQKINKLPIVGVFVECCSLLAEKPVIPSL